MKNPIAWLTKGWRDIQFCDCISKVIITDNFTTEYMEVFAKYPINAKLIQVKDGKKKVLYEGFNGKYV